MDLKIVRKNITASTVEKFEFDVAGYEFLVKNNNDFAIFVGFENSNETDNMIKIPAKCVQVCIRNKSTGPNNSSKNVYVYATSAGEVEVQCLKF